MFLFQTDSYKLGHINQMPKGTEYICSNLTARKSRLEDVDEVVVFGISGFVKDLELQSSEFFDSNIEDILDEYVSTISRFLNIAKEDVQVDHIKSLHSLGHLPITILSMPEGSKVKIGDPILLIYNTNPGFAWLTNYLETWMSNSLWGPITSATTARRYRKILDEYANKTSSIPSFVDWQGHDFSMRGMWGNEAAAMSGAGHLLFFNGTDTIPAIKWIENIYGDIPLSGSVPASEHSVMCAGSSHYSKGGDIRSGELELYRNLITEVYPTGIFSIVMDSYDYFGSITEFLPILKEDILKRDGKVVCRPDAGDPVEVICGYDIQECEYDNYQGEQLAMAKGSVELLWEIFGGTINNKGYKELDPHIGLIYGDSITVDRAEEICKRLERKGFATTNVVLGIGSFSYTYVTRDTFGMAIKATYAVINGTGHPIYKSPKLDDAKKSHKGIPIQWATGVTDGHNLKDLSKPNLYRVYFENGVKIPGESFKEVKERALS